MNIRILPGAAKELNDASIYYETQQAGLGARFLDIFDTGLKDLSESPDMYLPIGNSFRKYGLRPFPYAIIYRQDADSILIVAVMHQKRRPGYWLERS